MALLLFALAVAGVLYAYLGYPLLLLLWSRNRRPPVERTTVGVGSPNVTVIVAAYNEEDDIRARLENVLAQDYPADRLEVLVGSDGSSDRTVAAVRAFGDPRVRVLELPRRGRALVHNACVEAAAGEVVVFTDAATHFDLGCLAHLTAPFADARVGCSSGHLVYTNTGRPGIARSAGWYWRYELWLRRLETASGSTVAVTGACMALRKSLFRPLAADDDIDDAAPVDTLLAGSRVLFMADALAYDRLPESSRNELAARRRIVTKNLAAIVNRPRIIDPRAHPEAAFKLISHRVLRYLTPIFLVVLLVTNAFLPHGILFDLAWAAQLLFYGGALLGLVADRRRTALPICSTLFAFCLANVGFLLGLWNIVRGHRVTSYEPIR